MKNTELLADLVSTFAGMMHQRIDPLDEEAFHWRPDAGGNSFAHTVWHVSRWMDLMSAFVLRGRPHEEELWFRKGWSEKYGYNPLGLGFSGYGAITGYTIEEVNAIPRMVREDVVAYFDESVVAFRDQLLAMSDESLLEPAPGEPERGTAYQWIKALLTGELGHAGEIESFVAMRARASQT